MEDELFGWRNFSYFDLISHSYRNREDNFHAREFSAIFKFDNDILTEFVLDFNNRRIKLYDIRSIEFGLSFFKGFKDVLMDFIDESDHSLFDFETIDCVMYFLTVKSQEFHTGIVINKLKNREIITTDALKSLHFVHDNIGKFLVINLLSYKLGNCDIVVIFDVLF